MRLVKLALVVVVLAGLLILLLTQRRQLERLRAENASLRQQAGELAALLDNQEPRRAGPPPEESAPLRQERAELLRLRGEVGRLRTELRHNAALRQDADDAASARAPAGPQSFPTQYLTAATASVRSGETFGTGGWLTAPGTRTFFLATPKLAGADADGNTINISACWLQVPENELPEALLTRLPAQAQADSLVLTGPDLEVLLNKINTGAETNVLSRPRFTTSDGVEASMFVGTMVPKPDGTQRQVGTRVTLLPQLTDNGQRIRVGAKLEYMPPDESGGAGR